MRLVEAAIVALLALTTTVAAQHRDPTVPDPRLTPGVATMMGKKKICATAWGKDARHVTAAMKRKVFARYGLTGNTDPACKPDVHGRRCEVDHLISRELGGMDDILNLWPQPFGTHPWNAAAKDRLENRLHKEVCADAITLEDAQEEIRLDWRVPYRRYFGEPESPEPVAKPATKESIPHAVRSSHRHVARACPRAGRLPCRSGHRPGGSRR